MDDTQWGRETNVEFGSVATREHFYYNFSATKGTQMKA